MTKLKTIDQPSLFEFTEPDSAIHQSTRRKTAAGLATPRIKRTVKTSGSTQGWLPGLSRRGRPRIANAPSASVRALESRKRRLAAGDKRVELVLPAAIAHDLERLTAHFHLSRAEIIGRLITRAARRLPNASEPTTVPGQTESL